jgi:hypothetical protein
VTTIDTAILVIAWQDVVAPAWVAITLAGVALIVGCAAGLLWQAMGASRRGIGGNGNGKSL